MFKNLTPEKINQVLIEAIFLRHQAMETELA